MTTSKSLFASLALLFIIQPIATARPPDRWRQDSPNVSVEFLVSGRPLPQHSTGGGEAFVSVPQWGVEYEIRITNHERRDRVVFVIGVDGLSVMDGSRASEQSGGYVLDPGASTRIRGWRRGLDRVAAFTFTHRDDSYAERTGRGSHVGEVWVWAVREQSAPSVVRPMAEAAKEKASGSAGLHPRRDTGTGYGDELVDHVQTTQFVRSGSVRYLGFRYGLRPAVEPYYRDGGSGGNFTPPPPGWKNR